MFLPRFNNSRLITNKLFIIKKGNQSDILKRPGKCSSVAVVGSVMTKLPLEHAGAGPAVHHISPQAHGSACGTGPFPEGSVKSPCGIPL